MRTGCKRCSKLSNKINNKRGIFQEINTQRGGEKYEKTISEIHCLLER